MIARINNYIQHRLKIEDLNEVSLTEAAKWLAEYDILSISKTTPGYSLRRHILKGYLLGAYRKNNYFWFIKQIANFDVLLSTDQLSKIFNLKCRTSLYRKIQYHEIPYHRMGKKGIYFKYSDLVKWALERNREDIFELIKKMV
ncbi:MAG: helix-turn-helix domain-containing protein [Calditrichota bacterium]